MSLQLIDFKDSENCIQIGSVSLKFEILQKAKFAENNSYVIIPKLNIDQHVLEEYLALSYVGVFPNTINVLEPICKVIVKDASISLTLFDIVFVIDRVENPILAVYSSSIVRRLYDVVSENSQVCFSDMVNRVLQLIVNVNSGLQESVVGRTLKDLNETHDIFSTQIDSFDSIGVSEDVPNNTLEKY
jgi:hypothetical protein